jgi:two-component system, cell cycle response regulator DivK
MKARLLVIEDDTSSLELVKYLLEQAGYSVVTVMTGEAGYKAALRNEFDLVLCDLQLPVMSGFDIIQRLQAHADWRPIPLIAVTAYSMPGDRDAAIQAGFTDYMTKPIDPVSFLDDIARHIAAAQPAREP